MSSNAGPTMLWSAPPRPAELVETRRGFAIIDPERTRCRQLSRISPVVRIDTHDVRIDRSRGLVVKRFRSTDRGEPVREWTALSLLDRWAPGLAPAPISADLKGDFPVITMSLLPGTELSAVPVTPERTCALAGALDRLWRSVPSIDREYPAAVAPKATAFTRQVREMLATFPVLGDDPVVMRAHARAGDPD